MADTATASASASTPASTTAAAAGRRRQRRRGRDDEDEGGVARHRDDVDVDDDDEVQVDDDDDDDDDDEDEDDDVHDDDDDIEDDDDDPETQTPAAAAATATTPATAAAAATTPATAAGDASSQSLAAAAQPQVLKITAVPSLDDLLVNNPHYRQIGREALCWQASSAKPGNGVDQMRDAVVTYTNGTSTATNGNSRNGSTANGNANAAANQATETYWQSDGTAQPHWIQVQFARRVAISHVCLYLDYSLDESYTPKRLRVHVGMTHQDLVPAMCGSSFSSNSSTNSSGPNGTTNNSNSPQQYEQVELHEPTGWCVIPLAPLPDPLDDLQDDSAAAAASSAAATAASELNADRVEPGVRAHLIRISISSMHQNGRDTHVRQLKLFGPRLGAPKAPHYVPQPVLQSVENNNPQNATGSGRYHRGQGGDDAEQHDGKALDMSMEKEEDPWDDGLVGMTMSNFPTIR